MIFGRGAGIWSFVRICDAAETTWLVVEHGKSGIYNIVDDNAAPVSDWLRPWLPRSGRSLPKSVQPSAQTPRVCVGVKNVDLDEYGFMINR
jgi:nucleoside-diphosphate-sugar epimerase